MKNDKFIHVILLFFSISSIIATLISFFYITQKVKKVIGTGPESGWTFFFVGIPMYIPFLILFCVTIVICVSSVIYFIVYNRRNKQKKRSI